jgi:hypothetical protein
MILKLNWLLTVVLTLFVLNSGAQNLSGDSVSSHNNPVAAAVDYYHQNIAEQSEIYNGAAYEAAPAAYKGSVYFQNKNYPTPATIRYNGILYKNIPLLYDIYSDVMVASSLNNFYYILRAEKVSDIYLSGHHFIYLNDQTDGLKPGFYDQLYAGTITVLVRRTKLVSNNVTLQAVEVTYRDNNEIYLKKQGKYSQVNSKSSVMNILKDKEKELNQYISSNKIKYNKDKEASIAAIAEYYDQITH